MSLIVWFVKSGSTRPTRSLAAPRLPTPFVDVVAEAATTKTLSRVAASANPSVKPVRHLVENRSLICTSVSPPLWLRLRVTRSTQLLLQPRLSVIDQLLEKLTPARAVLRLECLDDLGVPLHEDSCWHSCPVPRPSQSDLGLNEAVEARDPFAADPPDDHLVESAISVEKRRRVISHRCGVHRRQRGTKVAEPRAPVTRGELQRDQLERAPRLVHVRELVEVELRHSHALVEVPRQQPLRGKDQHRLARGVPRDPECCRGYLVAELRPRRDVAVEELLPDHPGHLLCRARPLEPRAAGRRRPLHERTLHEHGRP